MSRELSSLPRLDKRHKCSRNKQKNSYSKKMETTYSSQVWNIKEGGPMLAGRSKPSLLLLSPVHESGGFCGSSCHRTKKDL